MKYDTLVAENCCQGLDIYASNLLVSYEPLYMPFKRLDSHGPDAIFGHAGAYMFASRARHPKIVVLDISLVLLWPFLYFTLSHQDRLH